MVELSQSLWVGLLEEEQEGMKSDCFADFGWYMG